MCAAGERMGMSRLYEYRPGRRGVVMLLLRVLFPSQSRATAARYRQGSGADDVDIGAVFRGGQILTCSTALLQF